MLYEYYNIGFMSLAPTAIDALKQTTAHEAHMQQEYVYMLD